MTSDLVYLKGDATHPQVKIPGTHVTLIHVVNNDGGWGAGFVLALSRRWKLPEIRYRERAMMLGESQRVNVQPGPQVIDVVNMCAQDGYADPPRRPCALNYEALARCLHTVVRSCLGVPMYSEIHCPKIGAGLAGGDWKVIEGMLLMVSQDVPVRVYEL